MSKRFLSLTVSLCLLLFLVLSITIPPLDLAQAEANSQTTPVGIPISRHNSGIIQNSTLGVFGPQICTAYGDPFSPLNSPWEPGIYTHTFQIRIPANYPDDVVRVELFDPDSVNRADNDVTIKRTSFAISNGGLPVIKNDICGSSGSGTTGQRRNPCVFETGETSLVDFGQAEFDQINPFWFKRVDENRGSGSGNGDGTCTQSNPPPPYEPRYNTETRFGLYYYRQTANGEPVKVPIASYIGYMGDPARDPHDDHQTDLRWVSPGADKQGYDFPIADVSGVSEVPTAEGNSSFEVTLADVANIVVDPISGDRFFYLDVTTLSGASENAYHIWAGPDDYVETSASDVNERNLAAINNPGSHDSKGVQVEAISRLTMNNLYPSTIDVPLGDFSPSAAGGAIYVNAFDLDSGVEPPLTFYFDSINKNDWSMTFSDPGVDDPDGVAAGTRCNLDFTAVDNCNDTWTTPAYRIDIPGDLSNCDFQNPTAADCTPFVGGRLMVDLNGGTYDSHAWEITAELPTTVDTTQSCAASPIAVSSGIHSVTGPGTGGTPYPDLQDFDYPAIPPRYEQFLDHIEGADLSSASEGTLFKLSRGFSYGAGNFGWLKWNLGITGINGSGLGETAVLSNSLTWPGDSLDYADHSDPGNPVANGIPHVVRGYVKPGDSTVQSLRVDEWVPASPAQLPEVATAVNSLIDSTTVLRMVVWESADSGFGPYGRYTIQRFALFKIIGYGNSAAEDEWLLLEFMGWDDTCGQVEQDIDLAVSDLEIIDPGTVQQDQPFSAQVTVSNLGTVDIDSQFFVDFYLNPSQTDPFLIEDSVGFTAVSSLPAGTQKTITVTLSGTHQQFNNALYAMVDSLNQVTETDETNNVTALLNFDVLPRTEWFIYLPFVATQIID